MKRKIPPRQITYNMEIFGFDQVNMPYFWEFFIFNEPSKFNKIEQGILGHFSKGFATYNELSRLETGVLVRTGKNLLKGRMLSFRTHLKTMTYKDRKKIYETPGIWKRDTALHRNMNDIDVDNYATQFRR